MLDFHSGDDLCSAARQAIGRATHGWCHFKVSPSLQVIFGEVLHQVSPERFRVLVGRHAGLCPSRGVGRLGVCGPVSARVRGRG